MVKSMNESKVYLKWKLQVNRVTYITTFRKCKVGKGGFAEILRALWQSNDVLTRELPAPLGVFAHEILPKGFRGACKIEEIKGIQEAEDLGGIKLR